MNRVFCRIISEFCAISGFMVLSPYVGVHFPEYVGWLFARQEKKKSY